MSKHDKTGSNDSIEVAGDGPYVAAFIDTALRDPRLSWKAKGLAAYLLSKPKGWRIWTADLIKRSTDGRDAVLSGLAELEAQGYLKRERTNDPDTGHLRWRKTITATPSSLWQEQPLPENPVMGAEPSPGFPYTGEPYTVQPSTVNPPHSISQGSSTQGSSSNKSEEEGAVGAEAATPTASEGAENELTLIARILADCQVAATPATLAARGFEHVRAEAARWWNETPAHKRKANAGLLVYRIKNKPYRPLSEDERNLCERYGYWVLVSEDAAIDAAAERMAEKAPVNDSADRIAETAKRLHDDGVDIFAKFDPSNPASAWSVLLAELKLERGDGLTGSTEGAQMWRWLRNCSATVDGDTLAIIPPNDQFTSWSNARLAHRLNRKLAVITQRAPGAPTRVAFQA